MIVLIYLLLLLLKFIIHIEMGSLPYKYLTSTFYL